MFYVIINNGEVSVLVDPDNVIILAIQKRAMDVSLTLSILVGLFLTVLMNPLGEEANILA